VNFSILDILIGCPYEHCKQCLSNLAPQGRKFCC